MSIIRRSLVTGASFIAMFCLLVAGVIGVAGGGVALLP